MRFKNENEAIYGKEPVVDNLSSLDEESQRIHLGELLNYYNMAHSKKEKKEWFLEYLNSEGSKEEVRAADSLSDSNFVTAGIYARLWMRGFQVSMIGNKLTSLREKLVREGQEHNTHSAEDQQRRDLLRKRKQEAEDSDALYVFNLELDNFLATFKTNFDMNKWIFENKVSSTVQSAIKQIASRLKKELILSQTDEDFKEAYRHIPERKKKDVFAFLESILTTEAPKKTRTVTTRKPRKKSPEKLVKKLLYQQTYDEFDLNLKSIDPKQIIEAQQLWAYNTKTRVLTQYVAKDADGLTVKGSTIINISEENSQSKKLRKPKEVLTQVLAANKVALRKIFTNLTTQKQTVNGRINRTTILLRTV